MKYDFMLNKVVAPLIMHAKSSTLVLALRAQQSRSGDPRRKRHSNQTISHTNINSSFYDDFAKDGFPTGGRVSCDGGR